MRKLICILLIPFLFACNSENKNIEEETAESNSAIEFSEEQQQVSEIETSKPEKRTISKTIECTGTIEVPQQNMATVSPFINGFIKSLNYYPGNKVTKGDVLAILQHPDFITIQQQYIEAKSQAEYFQAEYKRQGELTVENAASIKKMQKAKADFLSAEAMYKSLKAQLKILGINPVAIEKGDFEINFKLISPINGTVSKLNGNTGKFVNPNNVIYEIINNDQLLVNLNIFEKDIPQISKHQKISFNLLNDSKEYIAKVKRIGIDIDKMDKTTIVQGIIENKNNNFIPGKTIKATIHINEKEVLTIPSSAIQEDQTSSYIFVKNNNSFERVEIEKGIEQDGFCELLNATKLINSEIVINGSYYLMSAHELNE
jgi:cobalt-zinc-cadmium efflux system membrane fusion protein